MFFFFQLYWKYNCNLANPLDCSVKLNIRQQKRLTSDWTQVRWKIFKSSGDYFVGIIYPHCTEVRFASFLTAEFITAMVVDQPERKLSKCTSVQWMNSQKKKCFHLITVDFWTKIHLLLALHSSHQKE